MGYSEAQYVIDEVGNKLDSSLKLGWIKGSDGFLYEPSVLFSDTLKIIRTTEASSNNITGMTYNKNDDLLYIFEADGVVRTVDPLTLTTRNISPSLPSGLASMVYDEVNNLIHLTLNGEQTVKSLNASNLSIVRTSPKNANTFTSILVYNPDNNLIYVGDNTVKTILAYDASTLALVKTSPVQTNFPSYMVYDSVNKLLHYVDYQVKVIKSLNPITLEVVKTSSVKTNQYSAMMFNKSNNLLYVADNTGRVIQTVNPLTLEVVSSSRPQSGNATMSFFNTNGKDLLFQAEGTSIKAYDLTNLANIAKSPAITGLLSTYFHCNSKNNTVVVYTSSRTMSLLSFDTTISYRKVV